MEIGMKIWKLSLISDTCRLRSPPERENIAAASPESAFPTRIRFFSEQHQLESDLNEQLQMRVNGRNLIDI